MKRHSDEIQAAQAAALTRRWFLRDCGIGLAGTIERVAITLTLVTPANRVLQRREQ